MGRRVDLYVDLPDDTGRVDQEGVPRGERLVPVRREGSVRLRDNRLSVGEQLEVLTFLRAEALVRVHRVDADAEDDRVRLFVLREVALEVVGLHRAAGREVLRIEVEDDPLPLVLIERDRRPFLARKRERGRFLTGGGLMSGGCERGGEEEEKGRESQTQSLHAASLAEPVTFPGRLRTARRSRAPSRPPDRGTARG